MKTTKGRGIIYVRRSTSKQEESLVGQLKWGLERAADLGIAIDADETTLSRILFQRKHTAGDLYVDDGISGSDMNRPGFLAFYNRGIADPAVTHCMFWARDRFARPEHAEQALAMEKNILQAGKSTVVAMGRGQAPRERWTGDHTGDDIVLLIEYGAAGRMRPELAGKVLRAFASRSDRGYSCGGRAPYGFKRVHVQPDGNLRDLQPTDYPRQLGAFVTWLPGTTDEAKKQQAVIRRIYDCYLRRNLGLHRIAKTLTAEGIPSPGAGQTRRGVEVSGKWNAVMVRHILEQPIYCGMVAWARTAEGSTARFEKGSARGFRPAKESELHASGSGKKITFRDRESWVLNPAPIKFDPIVPKEEWDMAYEKVLAAASSNGQRGKPKCRDSNKYPMRVICGDCGKPMQGAEPDDNVPRYYCSTNKITHGKECFHNRVPREAVVLYALAKLAAMFDGPSLARLRTAIKARLEKGGSASDVEVERSSLQRTVDALERRRQTAYHDKLSADDDLKKDAEVAYARLAAECKEARQKLVALPDADAKGPGEVEIDKTVGLLRQLHKFLGRVPDSMLRETFTRLKVEATVSFDHVHKAKRTINVPKSLELRFGATGEAVLGAAEALPRAREAGTDNDLRMNGRGDRI